MTEEEGLKQAIALIKAGKKNEAVPILKSILKTNRNNELAWLWLSTCADKQDDKIYCFQEALRINPNNEPAKKALEQLKPQSIPRPTVEEMGGMAQSAQPVISKNSAQSKSKESIFDIFLKQNQNSKSQQSAINPQNRKVNSLWMIIGIALFTLILVVIVIALIGNTTNSPENVSLRFLYHQSTSDDISTDGLMETDFFEGIPMVRDGIWGSDSCDITKTDCGWTILSTVVRDGTISNTESVTINFATNNTKWASNSLWSYFVLERQSNRWVIDCAEGNFEAPDFPNLCLNK
jgi:hypothetical protein